MNKGNAKHQRDWRQRQKALIKQLREQASQQDATIAALAADLDELRTSNTRDSIKEEDSKLVQELFALLENHNVPEDLRDKILAVVVSWEEDE